MLTGENGRGRRKYSLSALCPDKSHMDLFGFERGQGKTDVLGENTLSVHFAHHKSHVDLSGFSTRSPFVTLLSQRAQSGR